MTMVDKKVKVAVLALQGAFIEHEKMLQELGAEVVELRQHTDLQKNFDALVLPGGESTVQGKLLKELGMFEELKQRVQQGMPVLATCAGLILLANHFAVLPVTVKRNAYGRQLGSFSMDGRISGMGDEAFPMRFIRAPYITAADEGVEVLAKDGEEHIVGVRYRNILAFAFHPELTEDARIHRLFLETI